MAFAHTNSRGQQYFLHSKEVTLKGGQKQRIFYFARAEQPGLTLDAVPDGYMVSENPRTGLPLLKKQR